MARADVTVAMLRDALAGLPDHLPVRVVTVTGDKPRLLDTSAVMAAGQARLPLEQRLAGDPPDLVEPAFALLIKRPEPASDDAELAS